MRVDRLWLTDFRNYVTAELELDSQLTAVVGANGQGKTNLMEALAWLATLGSFRSATSEALIRSGQGAAFVRAEGDRAGRALLIEAEIAPKRHRVLVNRQRLARARDLLGILRVTVFTPEDLGLVKEGPAGRRQFLDTTLVALDARHDATVREVERVLRQRNALLRQVGGRLSAEDELTLEVWDAKLAAAGELLADARAEVVNQLRAEVARAYSQLAGTDVPIDLCYSAAWRPGLAAALAASRRADVARGVTLVGPHRDELEIWLAGMPARSHASQGEQRSLALSLRLAAHRLVTEAAGESPLLLLDDVFSELDPARCAALLRHLPPGQALLTSADRLPVGTRPQRVYRVENGRIAGVAADEGGWN
ncbi:MAG: replication and repair protein RecF [Acidimicrobiia bacterium]|nr:replication and repair protein RecF [Acidimicrobiia bacterium]